MSSENRLSLIEPRFLVLTGLVLLAALARTIDHGNPNFAPIGAIALFGGACFGSKKLAFLVPGFALLLSDLVLNAGRHQNLAAEAWMLTAFTYGAFALVVCLGFGFRNRNRTVAGIFVGSLAASAVFFAISNFGWWAVLNFGSMGLPAKPLAVCYIDAIPFFRFTVMGDIFFNTVLFGSLALAENRFAVLRPVQVA
jgi:hypothetical protein